MKMIIAAGVSLAVIGAGTAAMAQGYEPAAKQVIAPQNETITVPDPLLIPVYVTGAVESAPTTVYR